LDEEKGEKSNTLYLVHQFEGKPLLKDFIPNTLLGIEYLWGGPVELETMEIKATITRSDRPQSSDAPKKREITWQRVVYTMKNRKLSRRILA
jgi:stage V sporulation protein R